MKISESDIVVSVNGRDSGKMFFVIGVDEEYVLLADGKRRRVDKPKRKKIKHVQLVSASGGRTAEKIRSGEKITNSDLRRALAAAAAGKSEV